MKLFNLSDEDLNKEYIFEGVVELFPQAGGWYFVRVPEKYSEKVRQFADRGLVAVTAKVGRSAWKTSLLPYGDGTLFIALNAKVRKTEGVELGKKISVTFCLRER